MYGSVIAELDSNQLLVGAASRHAFETQIRELQKQVSCPRASLLLQFRLIWRLATDQTASAFRLCLPGRDTRVSRCDSREVAPPRAQTKGTGTNEGVEIFEDSLLHTSHCPPSSC